MMGNTPQPQDLAGREGGPASPDLAALAREALGHPELRARLRDYTDGHVLLREGEANDSLYVILDGKAILRKEVPALGHEIPVSEHGPGDLLGVNSFATRQPSFCTAIASAPLRCLKLNAASFEMLIQRYPTLHQAIESLIVANLANRYRSAVSLQLELRRANRELRDTRNQLIHQEKLAMLGELVAGIAHELNNPAAAIERQRDFLVETLAELFENVLGEVPGWRVYWEAGTEKSPPLTTLETREKMDALMAADGRLPRSQARRVAALPQALADEWLGEPGREAGRAGRLGRVRLAVFEVARLLRSQRVGVQQITHLVASLRDYARPGSEQPERVAVEECIENVLVILGNLTRNLEVETQWQPGAVVMAKPGDVQQILTNLIKNAAEAMAGQGKLWLRTEIKDKHVRITVADSGPGIPEEKRQRIFDVNYTTKTGGEQFGLGLGLSITQGLVHKLNGHLEISETSGGGATFTVILPLA